MYKVPDSSMTKKAEFLDENQYKSLTLLDWQAKVQVLIGTTFY